MNKGKGLKSPQRHASQEIHFDSLSSHKGNIRRIQERERETCAKYKIIRLNPLSARRGTISVCPSKIIPDPRRRFTTFRSTELKKFCLGR